MRLPHIKASQPRNIDLVISSLLILLSVKLFFINQLDPLRTIPQLKSVHTSNYQIKTLRADEQIKTITAVPTQSPTPFPDPTLLSSISDPQNKIQTVSSPPSSGYHRQSVRTDFGTFTVDSISADLNNTRVIADTASDSDCTDNCPLLSLGDYIARSGAYAGVNGGYFCPSEYPNCSGKTNSFDTLLMNKNKKYFNSDNNIYSTVPAIIISGTSVRYVTKSLEWGRDTNVDMVIANHPLLVLNGQVVFNGNDDIKQSRRDNRGYIGTTGSTVYIGVAHGVSCAEMAKVLVSMGIQNALNLDSGGSVALWSGGYIVGPGRNIPNAVLFVRR